MGGFWITFRLLFIIITAWETAAITNKRPLQRGPVRDFRHIAGPSSANTHTDWEIGLREATNQALLREGYQEPNLRDRLLEAALIGKQDTATPFGDIAVLARGQLYVAQGGIFAFVQDPYRNDCDDCHNARRQCIRSPCEIWKAHQNERLVALWTVKRLRHREYNNIHRYELEYTISPIGTAISEGFVTRNGHFDYAIPGHVFVVKNGEAQPTKPNPTVIYNRKIPHRHFKPEVLIGVSPDGHKHILHSYPGFYTSFPVHPTYHQQGYSTNDPKEIELYKALIESLAAKTSTTQKIENGPHRFSLNQYGGIQEPNKVHSTKPSYDSFLSPKTPLVQLSTGQVVPLTEITSPITNTPTYTQANFPMTDYQPDKVTKPIVLSMVPTKPTDLSTQEVYPHTVGAHPSTEAMQPIKTTIHYFTPVEQHLLTTGEMTEMKVGFPTTVTMGTTEQKPPMKPTSTPQKEDEADFLFPVVEKTTVPSTTTKKYDMPTSAMEEGSDFLFPIEQVTATSKVTKKYYSTITAANTEPQLISSSPKPSTIKANKSKPSTSKTTTTKITTPETVMPEITASNTTTAKEIKTVIVTTRAPVTTNRVTKPRTTTAKITTPKSATTKSTTTKTTTSQATTNTPPKFLTDEISTPKLSTSEASASTTTNKITTQKLRTKPTTPKLVTTQITTREPTTTKITTTQSTTTKFTIPVPAMTRITTQEPTTIKITTPKLSTSISTTSKITTMKVTITEIPTQTPTVTYSTIKFPQHTTSQMEDMASSDYMLSEVAPTKPMKAMTLEPLRPRPEPNNQLQSSAKDTDTTIPVSTNVPVTQDMQESTRNEVKTTKVEETSQPTTTLKTTIAPSTQETIPSITTKVTQTPTDIREEPTEITTQGFTTQQTDSSTMTMSLPSTLKFSTTTQQYTETTKISETMDHTETMPEKHTTTVKKSSNQSAPTTTRETTPTATKSTSKATSAMANDFLSGNGKIPSYTNPTKSDFDEDDIFGSVKVETRPTMATTRKITESELAGELFDVQLQSAKRFKTDTTAAEGTKIIYGNFFEASTTPMSHTMEDFDTMVMPTEFHKTTSELKPLTSQSYATSISFKVNKKNKTNLIENIEYEPAIMATISEVMKNDEGYTVYKAELPIETTSSITDDTKKAFDDVALQLVNHARSINTISEVKKDSDRFTAYTTELPMEMTSTVTVESTGSNTKKAFDDVALQLVNHARSINYLSTNNKTRTSNAKYKRRRNYIPKSRRTGVKKKH